MKMEFEILKVTIVINEGTDKVLVKTSLPCPYPPCITTDPLMMSFDITKGKGIDYVRKNFGIEPEVINIKGL